MKVFQRLTYKQIFECILVLILLFVATICTYMFILYTGNSDDSIGNNDIIDKELVNKEQNDYLSLVMIGDSLIHEAVYADAHNENGFDFKPMFQYVKPIISKYDLAFYNQESILGGSY